MQTDGGCFRCSDVVLQRKKAHDQWLWKPFLPVIVKRYLFEWAHAFQSLPPRWEKPMKDMNRYEKGWMHFEHRGMAAPNTNRFFRRDVVILCGSCCVWINSGTGAHEAQFSSECLVSSKARYRISRLSAAVCSTAIRFWSFLVDHHWSLVKPFWMFFDFFWGLEDDSLQSCRQWLETRRDIQLNGLEQELRQMESSYEEIVVWFHMEDFGLFGSIRHSNTVARFDVREFLSKDQLACLCQFGSGELMFQHVSKCQSSPMPGKLQGSKIVCWFWDVSGFSSHFALSHIVPNKLPRNVPCEFFRTKAFASQRMNSLGSGQSS